MTDGNSSESGRRPLLIAGASVRAAAASAVRGGFRPAGVDLFADEDLRKLAPVCRVDDYPAGLLSAAQQFPPSCWMYTGGLENHPEIVAAISRRHRLAGNPPAVLRAVRNPFRLAEALAHAGLPVLAVRPMRNPPPRDGNWLRKPLRGAAGHGIAIWDTAGSGKRDAGLPHDFPHYFQRRATGTPLSAVFVARAKGDTPDCRLLGVTRQLVGEPGWNAEPFSYCGSLGPVRLPDHLMRQVEQTGITVAAAFALRGVFGVDLIADSSSVWCVEVNPRYPASAEVLEYAAGISVVALHIEACRSFGTDIGTNIGTDIGAHFGTDETNPAGNFSPDTTLLKKSEGRKPGRKPAGSGDEERERRAVAIAAGHIVGKGVLFAGRTVCWPACFAGNAFHFPECAAGDNTAVASTASDRAAGGAPVLRPGFVPPSVADVPPAGTVTEAGHPLCTVFAAGATVAECLNRLSEKSRKMYEWLEMSGSQKRRKR